MLRGRTEKRKAYRLADLPNISINNADAKFSA